MISSLVLNSWIVLVWTIPSSRSFHVSMHLMGKLCFLIFLRHLVFLNFFLLLHTNKSSWSTLSIFLITLYTTIKSSLSLYSFFAKITDLIFQAPFLMSGLLGKAPSLLLLLIFFQRIPAKDVSLPQYFFHHIFIYIMQCHSDIWKEFMSCNLVHLFLGRQVALVVYI